MLFTDAITWNGQHSYNDFGLTIRTVSGDIPKQQTNTVRVPYQQGEHDFSYILGKPTFDARKIQVTFNIEGEDPEDIYTKRNKVIKWLTSSQGGILRFDSIKDMYFRNVYAKILEYNNTLGRQVASVKVEFTAYPLMISDFTRPQYFSFTTTNASKTYTLTIDDKIIPCFSTVTACYITWKGTIYTIPANSKRITLSDIVFEQGANNFTLRGVTASGELTVECIQEVL